MGLLHLAAALAEYPDMKLALYNRSTTRKSAGKGQVLLAARSEAFAEAVRRLAPGRVKRMPLFGIEPGQVWCPRPVLVEVATYAKERGYGIGVPDPTRLVRGERKKNRNTDPLLADLDRLHEITFGVPLVSLADPTLTESERQSAAIRLSGKAGPKIKADEKQLLKVFGLLGRKRNGKWEHSFRQIAARCPFSKDAILRILQRPVPPELVGGEVVKWGELDCPLEILRGYVPQPSRNSDTPSAATIFRVS